MHKLPFVFSHTIIWHIHLQVSLLGGVNEYPLGRAVMPKTFELLKLRMVNNYDGDVLNVDVEAYNCENLMKCGTSARWRRRHH